MEIMNRLSGLSGMRMLLCAAALAAGAVDAGARTIQVGAKRPVGSIAVAAAMAKDGDTIEVDAGNYGADVAVWQQSRLTIRAVGGRARLLAMGAAAEGKGIWVVRGGDIAVDGFDFVGARVADQNGAGIRFEKGRLTVTNCVFTDNENGILTGGDKAAELTIENSEFGNNGAGDGQSHNLYVGAIRKLSVTGSYFHHAKVGHLLKSRAAENHIFYNRLTDEVGGRASYELEFPNGGLAYVVGNQIEQGSQTENATIISFGAEGYNKPLNALHLVGNTIADDRPKGGKLLVVKPGDRVVRAVNNLIVGTGSLDVSEAELANNTQVDWDVFVQASRQDFRLLNPLKPIGKPVEPGTANGVDLRPRREYLHPRQTRAL
jgi:hypothetical protein